MCGGCKAGFGKCPSSSCNSCPHPFLLFFALTCSVVVPSIMATLFVKGANDYADKTLSRGALQRSQSVNQPGLRGYFREDFSESMQMTEQRTKKR